MNLLKIFFIFLSLSFFLSACSPQIVPDNKNDNQSFDNLIESEILLEDVLKGKHVLALSQNNNLFLIDPDFAKPVYIYTLNQNEIPTRGSYGQFKVSPEKKQIVWYSPQSGLISLDIHTKTTKIVEPASEFFNQYPYFEFYREKDILNFITANGNVLKQINLNDLSENLIKIPYPYGNVFKISPNEAYVLFVSGYGQSGKNPKFMFTDINGNNSKQFEANTNFFDRTHVFWTPDSSGILLINGHKLDYYSLLNPNISTEYISLEEEKNINLIEGINENIFVYDNNGYWHVYDYLTKKELARTPTAIAQELNSPKFIPWRKTQFLIEETLKNFDDRTFNRLWISDFRGNKKIIIEKYNELIVDEFKPVLD